MSSHHIDTARITYKQDDTTPIMSKPHQPKPFAGAPSQEGDSANACTHNLQRQSQGKYLWSKTLSNLQEMTSGASLHIIGSIGNMRRIYGWYLSVRIYTHYPRGKLQFIRIKGMDKTWFITSKAQQKGKEEPIEPNKIIKDINHALLDGIPYS
eukprot:640419_1